MQITKRPGLISRALAPLLVVFQAIGSFTLAYAQDPAIKVDITTDAASTGGAFYTMWWFWVLVGLFVLIVIIALTRGGRTVVKS